MVKVVATEEEEKSKNLYDIFMVVDTLWHILTILFLFIAISKYLRKNIQYH